MSKKKVLDFEKKITFARSARQEFCFFSLLLMILL